MESEQKLLLFLTKYPKISKNTLKIPSLLLEPKILELLTLEDCQKEDAELILFIFQKAKIKTKSFKEKILRQKPSKLMNNLFFVKKILKLHPSRVLSVASQEVLKDEELMFESIKLSFEFMRFFPYFYKNDLKMIDLVENVDSRLLKFASFSLRNDKSIIIKAFKKNHASLEYASGELLNDAEFMKFFVKKYGHSLKFVGEKIRSNEDIIRIAIHNNPTSIQFCTSEIIDNESIVLEACKKNGYCIKFVSARLTRDIRVINTSFRSIRIGIPFTFYIPRKMFENEKFCVDLLDVPNRASEIFNYNRKIFENYENLMRGLMSDGSLMGYLELKYHNKDFVLKCCRRNVSLNFIRFLRFSFDVSFVREILKIHGKYITYMDDQFKFKSLIFEALENCGNDLDISKQIFQNIPNSLQMDHEIQWKCKNYHKIISGVIILDIFFKFI
jgi:hypothetical protein